MSTLDRREEESDARLLRRRAAPPPTSQLAIVPSLSSVSRSSSVFSSGSQELCGLTPCCSSSSSGIITGWSRDDWDIRTTTVGLDIRISPRGNEDEKQE